MTISNEVVIIMVIIIAIIIVIVSALICLYFNRLNEKHKNILTHISMVFWRIVFFSSLVLFLFLICVLTYVHDSGPIG